LTQPTNQHGRLMDDGERTTKYGLPKNVYPIQDIHTRYRKVPSKITVDMRIRN